MLHALEGSQAIAQAVALCRPGVVAAYPITPQTHIVENISKLVADGKLKCEFVSVESEFSAASVVLGSSAAGSRSYTASSSQGILLMAEVLFDIAGMRLPVVMTCANRAISAPINIWNDHQDSMTVRDSGWIQLHCADNQEAIDTSIQAFRIAERTELPVMVCMDGFVLTHTLEVVDMPSAEQVDSYLPPFTFKNKLDPKHPLSLGTLVGPEYYTEARYSLHRALEKALPEIEAADADWAKICGRASGGLLTVEGPENATTAVLAMGSVVSTLTESNEMLPGNKRVKIIKLRSFRPFPIEALQMACAGLKELIVLERAFSPGLGGILGTEVRAALAGMQKPPQVRNFTVGLGGRDIPMSTLSKLINAAKTQAPGGFAILDVEPERLPPEDR
ncbi:MAG: pyruvate ferredoxin oxidoreductase [Alphaproteobacteria bacterium]|jgi:pyruvate ferredoxin oxidoreductase alpha subunit|nr:pyruvate ferredoxin oxidoreductase [Alphaproteobacteria bacterium]